MIRGRNSLVIRDLYANYLVEGELINANNKKY